MSRINLWFTANKLSLNIEKCTFSFFTSIRNKNFSNDITIRINNSNLQRVQCAKYLGTFIDEGLKWEEHIGYLLKNLMKFPSIFYKIRSLMPFAVLKQIYNSLVHSHLLYGIELYANTYSKDLEPLEILNNKILRIMLNCNRKTPLQKVIFYL